MNTFSLNIFTFESVQYYDADEMRNLDKLLNTKYFVGCSKSARIIIDKLRIPTTEYAFVSKNKKDNNNLVLSNVDYKKAKLLLACTFVHLHFPRLNANNNNNIALTGSVVEEKEDANEEEEDDETIYFENVDMQPHVLFLEDCDKFTDNSGNMIEIEVRGERNSKQCYFKVKDVSIGFEMPNLSKTILNKDKGFERYIHYECFNRTVTNCEMPIKIKTNKIKQSLFLTYKGMLKVLFASRSGNAEKFQDWATEKLFVIQMGGQTEKDNVASELLGVSSKALKDVFRANSDKTPCVYLFIVANARDKLGNAYGPNDLIVKFGRTDDLPRRNDEHYKNFKKEFNAEIELYCFSIAESKWISEAETQINDYFLPYKLNYKDYKELLVVDKKQLPQIKKFYGLIQKQYIGSFAELENKMVEYKQRIVELENERELTQVKHQNELMNKDFVIQDLTNRNALKDKDIEILDLKLQILKAK